MICCRQRTERDHATPQGVTLCCNAAPKTGLLTSNARGGRTLKIGTLGAVVALPDDVQICQVLGGLDFLGWLNSRDDVVRHLIPNVWHSLNPSVPLAMSLERDVWGKFGSSSAFA